MIRNIRGWTMSGCKPVKAGSIRVVPTRNVMYSAFCKVIFLLVLALPVQVKPISPLRAAVDMLERNEIQRILLVRPAVEAGEKLGSCREI